MSSITLSKGLELMLSFFFVGPMLLSPCDFRSSFDSIQGISSCYNWYNFLSRVLLEIQGFE